MYTSSVVMVKAPMQEMTLQLVLFPWDRCSPHSLVYVGSKKGSAIKCRQVTKSIRLIMKRSRWRIDARFRVVHIKAADPRAPSMLDVQMVATRVSYCHVGIIPAELAMGCGCIEWPLRMNKSLVSDRLRAGQICKIRVRAREISVSRRPRSLT